jgi:ubiquinone/menaquinone biosynthesis C-methylase UbiE
MPWQTRPEIHEHYATGVEARRLQGRGRLEFERTTEILSRHLPQKGCVLLDVGGGPGEYAFWAAGLGHEVHLIDAHPGHVAQARERNSGAAEPLASAEVGDARDLAREDESVDFLLLLGPLYHLTAPGDRLLSLREARRVLRPGGTLVAAGISRFASALDGISRSFLADAEFSSIVDEDLRSGQHRNPANHPAYFTTAYFHRPEVLGRELTEAGFRHDATLAVEGPAWLQGVQLDDLDRASKERFMELLRRLEAEPSMLGASAHLLAVGTKGWGSDVQLGAHPSQQLLDLSAAPAGHQLRGPGARLRARHLPQGVLDVGHEVR